MSGLILVVALSCFYRFSFLGYSDYQGDEAKVLLRAERLIAGERDVIFEHKKGPGEILVAAASSTLSGRVNELETRLPFAIASSCAVVALYLAGCELFGRLGGLFAGLAAALNGYFIALGRIVQYQSFVLLFLVLAFYCLYRMRRAGSRSAAERYLIVAALFLAAAFLTHYEVAISLPVFLVLLVLPFHGRLPSGAYSSRFPLPWGERVQGEGETGCSRIIQATARTRVWVVAAGFAGVVAIAASFYVPFRLHPNWSTFRSYLLGERVGVALLHDNLREFVWAGAMYTDLYYLVLMGVVIFLFGFVRLRAERLRWWFLGLLVIVATAGALEGALAPQRADVIARGSRLLGSVLVVMVFLASRTIRTDVRVLVLWSSLYLVVYGFLVEMPSTHYYLAFPGLVLLFGAGASAGWEFAVARGLFRAGAARRLGAVAGGAACGILLYFPYMMFVSHSPEYVVTYPEHRNRLYITPTRDGTMTWQLQLGFPHRDGWRTLGYLVRTGVLAGTYETKEESSKVRWYLGQGQTTGPFPPRFRLVAAEPERWAEDFYVDPARKDYRLRCILYRGHTAEIKVFERAAFKSPLLEFDRDQLDRSFARLCTTERLVQDYRRGSRILAENPVSLYWLGAFRDKGDSRTKQELEAADRDEMQRRLTLVFQQRNLQSGTGARVEDDTASDGVAVVFDRGKDSPGFLAYGPYERFPTGPYTVHFWLKGEPGLHPEVAAVELDVASRGGRKILARRVLTAADFEGATTYRDFALEFVNEDATQVLEFRVRCRGGATVFLDRIEVSVNLEDALKDLLPM